jgi:tetratricopeptide (TPR) repeat protein
MADAYNSLGQICGSRGNPAKGVDYFKRALRADPDQSFAHLNLGRVYEGPREDQSRAGFLSGCHPVQSSTKERARVKHLFGRVNTQALNQSHGNEQVFPTYLDLNKHQP